jgi:hypothetical protein
VGRRDDERKRATAGRSRDLHDAALSYERYPSDAARRLKNEPHKLGVSSL